MGSRGRGAIFFFLLPSIAVLLLLFVYPFLYGLYLSFTTAEGAPTFTNYIRFFSDPYEARSILVTLWISVPATLINIGAAIPLAYYMRHGLRGEKIITFFLIVPITLGTVLISEGMLTYMGPVGWLNQFLMFLHIVSAPVRFTHNYLGVLIALIIQGFPLCFLMLLGYVSGINPDLEKASKMLGASQFETFRRVIFPLMVPGIAIAFCLSFVAMFSVFPSAQLLGEPSGPTRVMSIAAYHWAFEAFNFNVGSAISMTMAAIELLIISGVLIWRNRIYKGASIVGKG